MDLAPTDPEPVLEIQGPVDVNSSSLQTLSAAILATNPNALFGPNSDVRHFPNTYYVAIGVSDSITITLAHGAMVSFFWGVGTFSLSSLSPALFSPTRFPPDLHHFSS